MAVTVTYLRNHKTETVSSTIEYVTATFAAGSTYVTGGFPSNLLVIVGGPGTSPERGTTILAVDWQAPSGYIYRSSTAYAGRTVTTTTKVYSASGTELATGAAMPDTTVPVIISKRKV